MRVLPLDQGSFVIQGPKIVHFESKRGGPTRPPGSQAYKTYVGSNRVKETNDTKPSV